jgi:hypothetical protein
MAGVSLTTFISSIMFENHRGGRMEPVDIDEWRIE